MKNKTRKIIPVIVLFLAAAAAVLTFILISSSLRKMNREKMFSELIVRINKKVMENSFDGIEELLAAAADNAQSPVDWQKIIKNCYLSAKTTGSYSLLYRICLRAAEKNPDNETFRFYTVYAGIKSGAFTGTAEYADQNLYSAHYQYAKILSFLKLPEQIPQRYAESIKSYGLPLTITDPPALYQEAFDKTGISGYLLDAALLHLQIGNYSKAAELTGTERLNAAFPLFALYSFYDSGRFTDAARSISLLPAEKRKDPDVRLLTADIALQRKEFEISQDIYQSFIKDSPVYSAIPFLNAAVFRADPLPVLLLGHTFHPNNEMLSEAIIHRYYSMEEQEKALSFYNESIRIDRDNPALRLVYMQLFESKKPITAYINNLWVLLREFPGFDPLQRFFAYFLFTAGRFSELRILMDQITVHPETWWPDFYRALLLIESGEYRKAEDVFNDLLGRKIAITDRLPRWEIFFNLALISFIYHDFDIAAKHLDSARESITPSSLPGIKNEYMYRSSMSSWLQARIAYAKHDVETAWDIIRSAYERNPQNRYVRRLYMKLDSP